MSIRTGQAVATSAVAWTGAVLFALSLGWFAYSYLVRFGAPAPQGPIALPLAINFALFLAFALHHSLFARAGLKQWIRTAAPPELERSLYTWTASILFILVCALWMPVPGQLYRLEGIWSIAGYSVQAAGAVLTLRAGAAVDFLELAGVRQVQGTGYSAPPERTELQTHGLYGFVRHPLYFAWTLMVFGAPSMTATRAAFAVISTAYLMVAIPFEERSLVELFGPAYRQYQRKVRWRMIPGVY
jgi:protein-S-isoprenylcysteine O-methyltransferase Ste14